MPGDHQAAPASGASRSDGRPSRRLLRSGIVAVAAHALTGCTTVNVHQGDRVEMTTAFGLLHNINVTASKPLFIEERALGLSLSSSSALVGFRKTRSVYLVQGPDQCHVLVLVDNEKDLQEAADLLRKSSPQSAICKLGEEKR